MGQAAVVGEMLVTRCLEGVKVMPDFPPLPSWPPLLLLLLFPWRLLAANSRSFAYRPRHQVTHTLRLLPPGVSGKATRDMEVLWAACLLVMTTWM